jgi:SAM-dependent methyltransferase
LYAMRRQPSVHRPVECYPPFRWLVSSVDRVRGVNIRRVAGDSGNQRGGDVKPDFAGLSGHTMAAYPEIDMHALPYPDGNFDLVIHSDTLEHVAQPIRALSECYRVLRAGGSLCFTVPTIIGRLTRSRAGLAKSFHGSAATGSDDYVVHTEFGADMWTFVIAAGFRSIMIHTTSFPDATAMNAQKISGQTGRRVNRARSATDARQAHPPPSRCTCKVPNARGRNHSRLEQHNR